MSDTAITVTLDRLRTADVRPHLMELERITGVGIGRLVSRVIAGEYRVADLSETVRLGLLGGGAGPSEAAALAQDYVTARPLREGHALAVEILLAAWNGTKRVAAEIEPPASELDAEAGDVFLGDATGHNLARVEADGSVTFLNPSAPLPAWAESLNSAVKIEGAA